MNTNSLINYNEPKDDETTKLYAVFNGRVERPTIFKAWAECQKAINGYPGAKFKSFYQYHEAEEYLLSLMKSDGSAHIKYYSAFTSLDEMNEMIDSEQSIVLYVSGKYNKNDKLGYSQVLIKKGGRTKLIENTMTDCNSFKILLLESINNALDNIQNNNASKVIIVTAEALGFKGALDGKGTNLKSIEHIFAKIKKKNLKVYNYNFNSDKVNVDEFIKMLCNQSI